MRKKTDLFLVILVNFLWATQVPVIRLIGDRLDPITIAFVPLVISTLLFLPFLWMENNRRKDTIKRSWKDARYFVLPGLIGIFLMQYLYTVGSTLTSAANAGIITLTIPVLVVVFASIILKERLNIVRIVGFIVAIVGVLLTSIPDLTGADLAAGEYFSGNLIFLLACACCAWYNTWCKLLVEKKFTELEILVYSSVVASIACIPFLIWVKPVNITAIFQSDRIVLWGMLELSLVVYGFSMLLFFYILKRMDLTQAILGNYLLPFFIALLGIVLLGEKITLAQMVGGAIIIISTLMVTIYESRLLALFKRKRILSAWLGAIILLLATHPSKAQSSRKTISLNGSWQFAVTNNFDELPAQYNATITVPGLVDLAMPAPDTPYRDRVYWHKRKFNLADAGYTIAKLKLYKSMYHTKVLLNNNVVGENLYCFTPSMFDVQQYLYKDGRENEIIIGVGSYNNLPDTIVNGVDPERINYIPGIYDQVELQLSGTPYIAQVQTAPDLPAQKVKVSAFFEAPEAQPTVRLHYTITEVGSSKTVATGDTVFTGNTIDFAVKIPECKLWSPETPQLYAIHLSTGHDDKVVKFGMRSFSFDKDKRVALLNGKPYYMRGTNVCMYRFFEDPQRGTLPWNDQWAIALHVKFKKMHWNAMRHTISFPPERWYEIADSVGILLQDEYPIWWGPWGMSGIRAHHLQREYTEWMQERWNHSSVVIWDAQNESITPETGKAIQAVRGLDRSGRPWDNGWSPPQAETDLVETHPYLMEFLQTPENGSSKAPWTDLYTKVRIPHNGPSEHSPPAGGGKYPHPIIINEYEWLWLNRDGSPTTLTDSLYQVILGQNLTKDQRFRLWAKILAMDTEYWRSHRLCAGVLYFSGLSYSRATVPRGQTADNFTDVTGLVFEKHFERLMKPAFAPVGIMLDCWQVKYKKDSLLKIPVRLINDSYEAYKGTLKLTLHQGNKKISEVAQAISVPSLGNSNPVFRIRLPAITGNYRLTAAISYRGEQVFSEREFEVTP